MKMKYIEKNFAQSSLTLIDKCNEVIATYQAQRFTLTLRQLYYQMVSRNIIENTERSYKRLGSIVNDARLAGLIDWSAIEDRGRNLQSLPHWNSPADIIAAARQSFRVDKWVGQRYRPEVWVEKQALEGVVAQACQPLDVSYFACKGYNSQSEQRTAGLRLRGYRTMQGQTPVVIHLGDHDPSGIDMTRDNTERLSMFAEMPVEVVRIALNRDQIDQYKPPPNPAKETDSRFIDYRRLHGDESWELDALEPQVLVDLIQAAIYNVMDRNLFDKRVDEERGQKAILRSVENHWENVEDFVVGLETS